MEENSAHSFFISMFLVLEILKDKAATLHVQQGTMSFWISRTTANQKDNAICAVVLLVFCHMVMQVLHFCSYKVMTKS